MIKKLLPKSKLEQSLKKIRKQHPFLQEQNPIKQKEALRRLVSKIKTSNINQLDKCILNLSSGDLAVLPLAILNANDAALLDRFFKVISLRYDWWMYEAFWLQLQTNFPSEKLQNAFQKVTLLINQDDQIYDTKPFFLGEDFCALLPLTPINSEDFLKLLFNHFKDLNLKAFNRKKKDFHLQENTPLFRQLISQYALACDDLSFYQLKEQFSLFLAGQNPGYLNLFLNRILENDILNQREKEQLCYEIHLIFPCFHNIHEIWKKVNTNVFKTFKTLALREFFNQYCEKTYTQNPEIKEQNYKFYLKLLPTIKDIQNFEDHILFIKLQKGIAVAHKEEKQALYYYTLEQAMFLFEQGHAPEALATPHFTVHTLSPTMSERELSQLQSCKLSFKESLHHFNLEFLKLKGEFSNGLPRT